jgi:2',3'-cyclic-nucleotide 2'-phosphodiesterase (5'-nucleotidase family)
MRGAALRRLLADNYAGGGNAFLSVAGLHTRARCERGEVHLDVTVGPSRTPLDDARSYRVVTTDFLASGGDGFGRVLAAEGTTVEVLWDRPILHDVLAEALSRSGGTLTRASHYDPAEPRAALPGTRPICR